MELDILHRAISPEIVEFYGAFFIESCVYYCMEYMDAGSLDKLAGAGVPEAVLARITHSVVKGLKFLKDSLQIMHRGASVPATFSTAGRLTNVHCFLCRCEAHQRACEQARRDQVV
jgi:serine/threonine protein kinase